MTEQMRCFKDGRDAPLLPLLTKVNKKSSSRFLPLPPMLTCRNLIDI